MIDARGRILASLPLNQPGKIDAALPGALPATPWLAVGNVPVLTLLLLVLGLALWPRRRGAAAWRALSATATLVADRQLSLLI